ncbi:type II toxin-antitoxin system RelE/ParE family toxin [Brevundimonas sp.]|uniref:type II toxin-antitoxin system RelE/ParE family toxin n=1 Tax=Brevundimonas sp. TaxID=1871086 RepID=UPI003D0C6B1D
MPYVIHMEAPPHTVAETPAFGVSAGNVGMTDAEREAAILQIADDPKAGDMIVGSGGVRKVRVAGRGKGKSGGYRVATAYLNDDRPVYLLFVLSKGRAANFTDKQVTALKTMMDRLRGA